jgi:prepilin signal peptidase PulO-like enzyme (type II secretory pathway)
VDEGRALTIVAYAVSLSVLATIRALQGGPLPRATRYVVGAGLYALCVLGFALTVSEAPRAALGFAFLFVGAWTDMVARKVYLPVTIAAVAAAMVQAAMVGQARDALLGAAVMAAVAFIPYAVTRGRGFGFGDVLLAAVIGAAFGLHDGPLVFAFGFIVGAVVSSILLACNVIGRRDSLPLVAFVAAGSLVLVGMRTVGWLVV